MNCISFETHSETSSESYESYDENHRACKPQRSILILTLPPFLDITVFFTNAIDIRFGVYTSACATSETI
jgi:hypothetical protein